MKRVKKRQRVTPIAVDDGKENVNNASDVESVCIGPCARVGCTEECWIEIDAALTPLERSMELQSIVYCANCYTESLTLQPPLSFFSCHLNGSVVHTSNHPEFLSRNRAFNASSATSTASNSSKQDTVRTEDYEQAAQWIRNAKHVLIIAGAGMSADCFSGATFRGTGTMSKLGGNLPQEEIDYNNNPAAAWYYDWSIREWALSAEPHIGYSTLKALCQSKKSKKSKTSKEDSSSSTDTADRYFVITSNIDGMFLRSGFENVWETHGSTLFFQCFAQGSKRCTGASSLFTLPNKEMKLSLEHASCTATDLQETPVCPSCQGKTRFNISHLCDLPGDVEMHRKLEQEKLYRDWIDKVRTTCNSCVKEGEEGEEGGEGTSPYLAIIEVGCGASVHGLRPETSLLMSDHAQSGFGAHSRLIRINLISPNAVTASTTGTDINTAWNGDGDDESHLPGKPGLALSINAGAADALKKIQAFHDGNE